MPAESIFSTFVTSALLFCRIAPALRMVPFFGGNPMPSAGWLAVSAVLTLVMLPSAPPAEMPTHLTQLFAQAAKELCIGFFIGAMCRLAFSVLESSGRLARRAMSSTPFAPTRDATVRLYTLVGIVTLLLMGGHHSLIQGFAATLRCAPLRLFPDAGASGGVDAVLSLFSSVMAAAVLVTTPLFAASLISDLLLTALSRLLFDGVASVMDTARALTVQFAIIVSFAFSVKTSLSLIVAALDKLLLCAPV